MGTYGGTCAVCGRPIQRRKPGAPWKHKHPRPDGTPNDHKARP